MKRQPQLFLDLDLHPTAHLCDDVFRDALCGAPWPAFTVRKQALRQHLRLGLDPDDICGACLATLTDDERGALG